MRLSALALAFGIALVPGLGACAESAPPGGAKAPKTAGERARAEKAAAADDDGPSAKGKKWGGWRYQGRRDDCFFLVKRKCFDKRDDACAAARCGQKQCVIEGGGPATVRCE